MIKYSCPQFSPQSECLTCNLPALEHFWKCSRCGIIGNGVDGHTCLVLCAKKMQKKANAQSKQDMKKFSRIGVNAREHKRLVRKRRIVRMIERIDTKKRNEPIDDYDYPPIKL